MVVGCDLQRAQAIIRTRLGPWTAAQVKFKIVEYQHGKKTKPVAVFPDTILLYYDAKYDAVAITPKFRGNILLPQQDQDEESIVLSDLSESELAW